MDTLLDGSITYFTGYDKKIRGNNLFISLNYLLAYYLIKPSPAWTNLTQGAEWTLEKIEKTFNWNFL